MPLAELADNVPEILKNWPTLPTLFRRDPGALAHLWSIGDLNALVDAECVPARNVVLVKDGRVLERYAYIDGDMPRPGAIRAHLDDGGTVSVRQLQTVKPALSVLRREIQDETGDRPALRPEGVAAAPALRREPDDGTRQLPGEGIHSGGAALSGQHASGSVRSGARA
ncbi:hypothetical protein ACFWVF_23295 [Streptomyces sp. NPDC058659]|uniref:hypothetical protein n=1 Tax=unclassified Streptomyces TaxID=2593676 RepID=UPI003662DB3F